MKKEISTKNAPAAVGPYSQAIVSGSYVFCSGNIGIDPKTNSMVTGGVKEQTLQVFSNLKAVLQAAGSDINSVVKMNVYLKNMDDYKEVNELYAQQFQKPFPARAAIEVARLPKDALIEIECIAFVKEKKGECCGNCDCGK